MLRKFSLILFVLMTIAFFTAPLIAQSLEEETPTEVSDYFASIPGVAIATLGLTQVLKKLLNQKYPESPIADQVSQYISWAVAVLLSYLGFYFEWGIFAGISWYVTLIYALAAGLIANGIFDWQLTKSILQLFKLIPDDKKLANNRSY